jgi:stearoyl-CoA desaturase (Delta-9 desaturase)
VRATAEQGHPDVIYPATIPFVLLHLSCIAALWTGVTLRALVLFVVLYSVRLFAVTAGYHRYFAHRSYQTSRIGQFLLALIAQSTTQRGVLWWSAIHRHHHLHSDTELDVHSRRQHGFWYSHMGWVFTRQNDRPDYSNVQDLQQYPELLWLDRYPYFLPMMAVIVPCWLIAGWSGVIVGFCWSTTLLYHVTFAINSVGHGHGTQPYVTGDESRNSFWLALATMGEGWHNNHHAYQSSTRVGFRRGEIDIGYAILKLLSRVGLVWNLREPPAAVVRNEVSPGRRVIERLAQEVADVLSSGMPLPGTPAVSAATGEAGDATRALHYLRALYPDAPERHLQPIAERAVELLATDRQLEQQVRQPAPAVQAPADA